MGTLSEANVILSEAKDLLLIHLEAPPPTTRMTYIPRTVKKKESGERYVFLGKNKKRIRNALEKMARENEQTFGKGKMDCCQLNKNDKQLKDQ